MVLTRNSNFEMDEALKNMQLEFDQKLEHQNKLMMDMMGNIMKKVVGLQKNKKGGSEEETDEDEVGSEEETSSYEEEDGAIGKSSSAVLNNFRFSPKVEFPAFEGQNAKAWVQKCER
ncbi:unnamed protein product [Cuscuta epithymum]|uniref:Uncharacterized protein n=1 Tax=Cuscuta epithymum TaxID=186058 RepID=A0AAV0C1T6_9ASTE|nr:unnamed protein product [Cuscuta epithymum]